MKIAILGFGVVASGAYEVLTSHGYDVSRVLDIRPHAELGNKLTMNFDDILADDGISVVAEAIGGLEPAHTFVVKALKAGKHVVTSNKHLMCHYYEELSGLACDMGVTIRFTSSVGGGIPWLHNLRRTARCDEISKVMGILNGTTNFIVDSMISEGRDFADVLSEAQRLGYAEADPSADIDGLDVARKVAISASIAFGTVISESDVSVFSMRNISACDIAFAEREFKRTLRYMGFAVREGDRVCAFVEPVLLSHDSPEASVSRNFNMITLFGKAVGRLSFFGQGAGKMPTGHAMASDIIDIVNGDVAFDFAPSTVTVDNSACIRRYYVRTSASLPEEHVDSVTVRDGVNYVITNPMRLTDVHRIAADIFRQDGTSFFAGIEES